MAGLNAIDDADCRARYGASVCDALNSTPAFDPKHLPHEPTAAEQFQAGALWLVQIVASSAANPLTLALVAFCTVAGWRRSPWWTPAAASAVYVALFLLLGEHTRHTLGLDETAYRPQLLFVHAALAYVAYGLAACAAGFARLGRRAPQG